MRINFVRSGGFAGIPLKYEVNTESLNHDDAARWEQFVREANFFSLPQSVQPRSGGADRFQYAIEVIRGKQQHRVVTTDGSIPDSLQPLVKELLAAAKQRLI